jgi:uncharacterized protein YndB with AHSA1/START domain
LLKPDLTRPQHAPQTEVPKRRKPIMPALASAPSTVPTFLLTQTRVIRAPRARVYEAWTNPEIIKQWFGPVGMYCPNATSDTRVGGAYTLEAQPTSEAIAADPGCANRGGVTTGKYTKVVPNELLQFTWDPSWNPGELSLVTVSLKDADGGTEITILHENFPTEQSRDAHNRGWASVLDKFAVILQN